MKTLFIERLSYNQASKLIHSLESMGIYSSLTNGGVIIHSDQWYLVRRTVYDIRTYHE